jgi:hypothetical protein
MDNTTERSERSILLENKDARDAYDVQDNEASR